MGVSHAWDLTVLLDSGTANLLCDPEQGYSFLWTSLDPRGEEIGMQQRSEVALRLINRQTPADLRKLPAVRQFGLQRTGGRGQIDLPL